MKLFVSNLSYVAMKCFFLSEMDKGPCQIIFSCFLFEFLLRTSIRTPEAENLQKNKHIQPQPKFRCSNKKKEKKKRIVIHLVYFSLTQVKHH